MLGSTASVAGGALTVGAGVVTVLSGGLAAPLLVIQSGFALCLGGGLSGGLAALTQSIFESVQMERCQRAIEVDEESTKDLADYVESVKKRMNRIDKNFTVCEESLARRALALGFAVSDDLAKLFLSSSTRVLAGSLTAVLGGVMIPWDLHNLKKGINDLLNGNMSEASKQIRSIADQLKKALDDLSTVKVTLK